MADNVIRPAKFTRNGEQHDQTASAARRGEQAKHVHERNLARLREIERAIEEAEGKKEKGPVLTDDIDRIIAACAVGAAVDAFLQAGKGQNPDDIRKRAGIERIDRYMISARGRETMPQEAPKRLLQKVSGYLRIADAIARLTGQPADQLKISVLEGTSFWARPANFEVGEDARADILAGLLNAACHSIARESKLAKLFEQARRIPGQWDLAARSFRHSEMACLFQSSYLGHFEHWSEAPPLPSVPLVRLWQADFITKVRVESEGRSNPLDGSAAQDGAFEGVEREASFRLYREIRLALGPAVSSNEITPLFESRAHVSLRFSEAPDSLHELAPSFTLKPEDDYTEAVPASVFQVEIGGRWHRVLPLQRLDECEWEAPQRLDDPFSWHLNLLRPSDGTIAHWWLSWTALHADTVKLWLDQPCDGERVALAIAAEGTGRPPRSALFPRPSAAHGVWQALTTRGLEKALLAEIKHIRDALTQREKEWQEEISAATGDLLAEWTTDRTGDEQ